MSVTTGPFVSLQGTSEPLMEDSLAEPIPEINTETNTESIYTPLPIAEIITYLNKQTNANYKPSSRKTMRLIKARWNEGFRYDDFKKVIDIKTEEWLNDPRMSMFLRPETLFGPSLNRI